VVELERAAGRIITTEQAHKFKLACSQIDLKKWAPPVCYDGLNQEVHRYCFALIELFKDNGLSAGGGTAVMLWNELNDFSLAMVVVALPPAGNPGMG
jgi:hypothetical protein